MNRQENFINAFEPAEQTALTYGPFWVFQLVAAADGRIDEKEIAAFKIITDNAEKFENPLIRETMELISEDRAGVLKAFKNDPRKAKTGLRQLNALLEKAPPQIALDYKKMLIAIGFYIADSSGELYGYRVSDEEADILAKIAFMLGLNVLHLSREPSLNSNLDFLKSLYSEAAKKWK